MRARQKCPGDLDRVGGFADAAFWFPTAITVVFRIRSFMCLFQNRFRWPVITGAGCAVGPRGQVDYPTIRRRFRQRPVVSFEGTPSLSLAKPTLARGLPPRWPIGGGCVGNGHRITFARTLANRRMHQIQENYHDHRLQDPTPFNSVTICMRWPSDGCRGSPCPRGWPVRNSWPSGRQPEGRRLRRDRRGPIRLSPSRTGGGFDRPQKPGRGYQSSGVSPPDGPAGVQVVGRTVVRNFPMPEAMGNDPGTLRVDAAPAP